MCIRDSLTTYNDANKDRRLEKVTLKAARRDSIWGFKAELQMNPMPFHLESPWGATLMPIGGCAMDWDGTK